MNFGKLAMALATTLAFGAMSAQAAELKLANFMSPNHPFEKAVFGVFADKIAKATGGEVTVGIYSGGELGAGPAEQYNRVVDGVADFAYGLPGYTATLFPKTLLVELPGVIAEETGTKAVLEHVDMIEDEYRRVKLVGIWTNGENLLYMRDTPVRTLDDIKGKKIRVPSRNAGLIVESWGATPISMPITEVYNAMQTGVLDGAFTDGTGTFAFKLSDVTDYITTGMNSSISGFFLLMNRDAFDELTGEQQAQLEEIGIEISHIANKQQLSDIEKGLSEFAATKGKELIELTPEEAAEFNKASAPVVDRVIEEAESQGVAAGEFVEALKSE